MDYEMLKKAADGIRMPEEMKRSITKNCNEQVLKSMEDHTMKTHTNQKFLRKPAAVFAIVAVCLSLTVSAVAASGVLRGFFRDITDFRGAVVGTSYEQATDEIQMEVTAKEKELTVLAAFASPQMMPYSEAEKLGIAAYQIVDANGMAVKEGSAEAVPVFDGQAEIHIHLDGIDDGSYKLVVTAFVSEKKADQPLEIKGHWEAGFSR